MLIHVVADYGAGDLAFAEVAQAVVRHLPNATVVPTPVGPFDTVGAGFCVAQLALTDGPSERIIFHNVAPRADDSDPRCANEGERLVAGRAPTGALIVGPNAGWCFSFVRDEVDELREVEVPAAGSQFRSRDIFPEAIARLAFDERPPLGDVIDTDAVPDPPGRVVLYVDGYGNVKTGWGEAPVESGSRVRVEIDGATAGAVVSDGTFEVPDGELSFAPGSAGWPLRAGGERRFYELLLRGGSAAERLGHPAPGTPVEVSTSGC